MKSPLVCLYIFVIERVRDICSVRLYLYDIIVLLLIKICTLSKNCLKDMICFFFLIQLIRIWSLIDNMFFCSVINWLYRIERDMLKQIWFIIEIIDIDWLILSFIWNKCTCERLFHCLILWWKIFVWKSVGYSLEFQSVWKTLMNLKKKSPSDQWLYFSQALF